MIQGTLAVVKSKTASATMSQCQSAAQTCAAWLRETTWGQLALDPLAIEASLPSCSDVPTMLDAARAAVGIDAWRMVVVTNGCASPGAGWSSVGVVLVNTDRFGVEIVPHEMGHTFALMHNSPDDPADTMLGSAFRYIHFNAPHKGKMQWLLDAGWSHGPYPPDWTVQDFVPAWNVDITESQAVTLGPLELAPSSLPLAARIPVARDADDRVTQYLYLEYRQRIGMDAKLSTVGLHLCIGPPYNGFQVQGGNTSAPGSTKYLTTLQPGQRWQDDALGVQVTAQRISGGEATADIVLGTPPPPSLPPGDTTPPTARLVSPVQGATVPRRSTVQLTADVSDNVGVVLVTFLVDDLVIQSGVSTTCLWSVPGKPNATHRLKVRATDAAGNVGTSPTITVTSTR